MSHLNEHRGHALVTGRKLRNRCCHRAPSFMRQASCESANLAAWTLLPYGHVADKRRRGDAACRHAGTKSSQRGRIVLIGSRTASGAAGRGQYVATKSALNGMARSWATELARE